MSTSVRPLAVVTGGSRGIGAAIAVRLAHAGYRVMAIARTWKEPPAGVEPLAADLSDPVAVERCARRILDTGVPIGALINNAGMTLRGPIADLAPDAIHRVLGVDLEASLNLVRLLAPALAPGSSVVNITSIRAARGFAFDVAYSAAKGGLEAATRALAVELGERGIRVNAVSPGIIETDMNRAVLADAATRDRLLAQVPVGRLGTPDDISGVVEFLIGPAAGYISGVVLGVDGGYAVGR